jgi:DNA polymerase-1
MVLEARKDILKKLNAGKPRKEKMKLDDIHYGYVPIDIMTEYACKDTRYCLRLFDEYYDELEEEGVQHIYEEEERPLIRILGEMEYEGALIDVEYLEKLGKKVRKKTEKLQKQFNAYANKILGRDTINLNSPQQVVELFTIAGVPKIKETPTGNMSVDKAVLTNLSKIRGFKQAAALLEFRKWSKLDSTYIKNILANVDENGYCHGSYNSMGAKSGRQSCSEPNLTNQPRGPLIRRAFIVPEDYIFVSIDFSQVELRLAAHFSQEQNMLEIYRQNGDIHQMTADLLGCSRQDAKPINFGLLYGLGWKGLIANALKDYGIVYTPKQAKKYFNDFWNVAYPGLAEWVAKESRSIIKNGYAINYYGRKRRFPELKKHTTPKWQKSHLIRAGVNHRIQGTAADMLKIALVRTDRILKKHKARTCMLFNVHDEIDFYWHKDEFDLLPKVIEAMEDFPWCTVPIIADVSYSKTDWGHKKELVLN